MIYLKCNQYYMNVCKCGKTWALVGYLSAKWWGGECSSRRSWAVAASRTANWLYPQSSDFVGHAISRARKPTHLWASCSVSKPQAAYFSMRFHPITKASLEKAGLYLEVRMLFLAPGRAGESGQPTAERVVYAAPCAAGGQ